MAELVELVGADPYINGIAADAHAHRRGGWRDPDFVILPDTTWDRYAYFFYGADAENWRITRSTMDRVAAKAQILNAGHPIR